MIEAAIALVFLAFLAYREHQHSQERAKLLDRIQAPEVVVQRTVLENAPEDPDPIPVDMGPWTIPPPDEDDE